MTLIAVREQDSTNFGCAEDRTETKTGRSRTEERKELTDTLTNTLEISWTRLHGKELGERDGLEIQLTYDLGGQHWLCFRQADEDGAEDGTDVTEVWTNLPLSPDRLRRVLAGNMPLGHAAGNADYLMVHRQKNGWTQSATLAVMHRAENPPLDMPEFMTMGTLDFPVETFERWMEETAALPDPFMPERREQEPGPDEPGPEGQDQDEPRPGAEGESQK